MNINEQYASNSLDEMFDNLSDNIDNVNKMLSDLSEQKKISMDQYKDIENERNYIEKRKTDVDLYIAQKEAEIIKKKKDIDIYLENKQRTLINAENDFRKKMETSLKELELMKQEYTLEKQRIKEEKDQFEAYKNIEIEKIQYAAKVLNSDKEQFEKYRQIATERINLESTNLENRCSKFKDIVNQFNTNFKPAIDQIEE